MIRVAIAGFVLSTLLSACTVSQNMQYTGVNNFSVSDLGSNPKVNVDINLHNPNKIGATIKEMEFTVSVDKQAIGTAGISNKVHVKRSADFIVPVEINTSLDKMGGILSAGLKSFLGNSDVPIGIEGTFTIQKFIFFRKTFQFNYQDDLDVNKILKN